MTLTEWLEKQEALCEKATKGPWESQKHADNLWELHRIDGTIATVALWSSGITGSPADTEANAHFMAASRLSLPTALKIIRAWLGLAEQTYTLRKIAERILQEEVEP